MRLRAGLVVCLCALGLGFGCRQALTPADDRNQAPETWITAAPQDTITIRDIPGQPPSPPIIGNIPVRFHLYWAGADQDGAVTGFYWAVVETVATPIPGIGIPPLPGPRARDYRFTSRTDSTFIFNVAELSGVRQHAFFIYAVDNAGKPDPTPARFVFEARDRFPPRVLLEAFADGDVFRQTPGGTLFTKDTTYAITDTLNLQTEVSDFVPSVCRLTFRWRGEPRLEGTYVAGYKYKLDETDFVPVDSSVHEKVYPPGAVTAGDKVFTLRAVDQAGGATETTRRFRMNLAPDTWFSGPDPGAFGYTNTGRDRFFEYPPTATEWTVPLTGSLLHRDSVQVLPAARPVRKTFFEIYKNRIYVRSENDTVHLNSWVVLENGGFDQDSPYRIKVSPVDPNPIVLDPGATILQAGPPNGSPVGFRSFIGVAVDPTGAYSTPSFTGLYPLFDPTDPRRAPTISSYWSMTQSGRAFALVRAEDGDGRVVGGLDFTVPDPRALATLVDPPPLGSGGGTQQERNLRQKKVMTFFVNKSPALLPATPNFSPTEGQVLTTRSVDFRLTADDEDPVNPNNPPTRVGGPSTSKLIRFSISFRGLNPAGRDTTIAPLALQRVSTPGSYTVLSYPIPPEVVSANVTIRIEVCDCPQCELLAGQGRCINYDIHVTAPAPPSSSTSSNWVPPGPGSDRAAVEKTP